MSSFGGRKQQRSSRGGGARRRGGGERRFVIQDKIKNKLFSAPNNSSRYSAEIYKNNDMRCTIQT